MTIPLHDITITSAGSGTWSDNVAIGTTALTSSTTGPYNTSIGANATATWGAWEISIVPSTTYTISTTDEILSMFASTGYGQFDANVKKIQDHKKRAAVPVGCQLSFDF